MACSVCGEPSAYGKYGKCLKHKKESDREKYRKQRVRMVEWRALHAAELKPKRQLRQGL